MSTKTFGIGDILFGKIRGRVLALLYGKPEEWYFLRQIARHAHTSAGNVRRELFALANAGIVERTDIGNQAHFRANRQHPAFPELRALVAKTVGLFHGLNVALAPLHDKVQFAFVYGSVADDSERSSSDIDLMLVGHVSLDELLEVTGPVEKQLGRPVNSAIYTLEDLCHKLRSGNHFLRSLENRKKVFLIGDEDGFRGACPTRMVQG